MTSTASTTTAGPPTGWPGLWRAEDAKLLKLDAESRFTTNAGGSKLRMTRPFVEFDSSDTGCWACSTARRSSRWKTLTEGEVHDFREVGFQLTDNERDIAAAAAAIVTHWHQHGAEVPTVRRCDSW